MKCYSYALHAQRRPLPGNLPPLTSQAGTNRAKKAFVRVQNARLRVNCVLRVVCGRRGAERWGWDVYRDDGVCRRKCTAIPRFVSLCAALVFLLAPYVHAPALALFF